MAFSSHIVIIGLLLLAAPVAASKTKLDPIEKVLYMLEDLEAKITAAGEAEDKAFKEFFDWCDDAAGEAKNAITTATSSIEKNEALIEKSIADAEAATQSIAELV